MRLLYVPVLMSYTGIVPGRLHPVMSHEGFVAFGPVLALAFVQLTNGSRQMISAVLLGDASHLPDAALQSLGKRLKTLDFYRP